MAILRSVDGKFYDIPDDELANYEIPADKVKGMLGSMGPGAGPGPGAGGGPGPGGGGGGQVQPYGHCGFRNCGFRNHFRNCGFRNCGFRNCAGR